MNDNLHKDPGLATNPEPPDKPHAYVCCDQCGFEIGEGENYYLGSEETICEDCFDDIWYSLPKLDRAELLGFNAFTLDEFDERI